MSLNYSSYNLTSRNPNVVEKAVFSLVRARSPLVPPCVIRVHYDCGSCVASEPATCLLAADPDFASYLRYFVAREAKLIELIRNVIKKHGRSMYWDIIVAMVQDIYPRVSKQSIYNLLASCKADFASFTEGVYGLAEWKTNAK